MIKHKTFSLINILGFAFSISICLVIALFLIKEHSYDKYHANADQIFRLVDADDNSSSIDYRVKKAVIDNYPDVKKACLMQISSQKEVNNGNNGNYIDNIASVDNAYFEMFSVSFVSGNASKPLQNPNSVVLTESAVRTLFGEENPLGKEIVYKHKVPLIVTGVIKDFPDNSSIQANMFVSAENDNFRKWVFSCENYDDVSSHRYLFCIYLQLNESADKEQLINKINSHAEILAPYVKRIDLLPLKEMYLYDNTAGSQTKKGNPGLLRMMAGIGLTVLILAIINYINLTMAKQNQRNKEIGIRKTIGANRKEMVFLFLTESVLVTMAAFAVSLMLVFVGLPFFNSIIDSPLSPHTLMQFPVNILLFISIFLIGFLSGIGPALSLSLLNPVRAFSGGIITMGKKKNFRNILTVFQFFVSIALIICIVVVQKQINFVKHRDAGFKKEQLLRLDWPNIPLSDRTRAFTLIDKLRQYPGILNLSITAGVPGDIHNFMGSSIKGKNKSLPIIYADSSFLQTFNIQQIKGRELLPGDMGNVCMLNEAAYKYFEWNDLENKRYNNGKEGGFEVIGVVKDFHYASMHQPIEPMCILFSDAGWHSNINLRIAKGAIGPSMDYIQKAWKKNLPDYPLKYQFYDEWFDGMYRKEEQLAKTIGLFALLAIGISCMGIFGLATFSAERRTKEIGIRKVSGAQVTELMNMLNKDFVKWVAIAFVIACPIAWYAMSQWLQDFAYRTEISWWIFAISGLTALVIALLTVSWQTWRAATKNPVEALRYE